MKFSIEIPDGLFKGQDTDKAQLASLSEELRAQDRGLDASTQEVFVDEQFEGEEQELEPPPTSHNEEFMKEQILKAEEIKEAEEVIEELKEKLNVKSSDAPQPISQIGKKMEMRCVAAHSVEGGGQRYEFSGAHRAWFPLTKLSVLSDGTEEEERALDGRGRPPKFYNIEGIASSTSVDHYGTEMSYEALLSMAGQVRAGMPILPAHSGRNGGMGEWDEVIGRTYDADIITTDVAKAANSDDVQYTMMLRSRLYGEEEQSRKLVRRLKRGEPIGQSIGGWFNKVDVLESSDGDIERIIVRDLTLDHIAITRAPANPDSHGLMAFSFRSKIDDFHASTVEAQPEPKPQPQEVEEDKPMSLQDQFGELSEEHQRTLLDLFSQGITLDMLKNIDVEYAKKREQEKRSVEVQTEAVQPEAEETAQVEQPIEERDMVQNMAEAATQLLTEEEQRDLLDVEEMPVNKEEIEEDEAVEIDPMAQLETPEDQAVPENSNAANPMLEVTAEKDDKPRQSQEIDSDRSTPSEDIEEKVIEEAVEERAIMRFDDDLKLAAVDAEWDWDTTAQDEVLGKGLDNWKRYAKAHIYMDRGKDWETKGAYKLPIAKMDGGELKVVFTALAAAVAALNGARGGVKLDPEDMKEAHAVLEKYYKKFGKKIPPLKGGSSKDAPPEQKSAAQHIDELETKTLDNNKSTQHNSIENTKSVTLNAENIAGEKDMTDNDLTKIAELLRATVEPISQRLDALEQPKIEERAAKPEVKPEVLPSDVVTLQARLEKAEKMLSQVMQQPLRRGRHLTAQVRGVGSESVLDKMITLSKDHGATALAAVVSRHKEDIAEEVNLSKMSAHSIKDLLSSGLRAAEADGILAAPNSQWN